MSNTFHGTELLWEQLLGKKIGGYAVGNLFYGPALAVIKYVMGLPGRMPKGESEAKG